MSEVQKNRGIRSLAGDFATFNSPVLYKNPNPAPDTLDDVEYNTYLNVSDFRRLQFDIDIHDDEAPPPSFGD